VSDISEAILALARAQQDEADATRELIEIRKQEVADAASVAAERLASDALSRDELAAFRGRLDEIAPAMQMLVAIAKAMRGEMGPKE